MRDPSRPERLEGEAICHDGVDPVIEYYKQFVDRTLLRENLKLTPAQRLQKAQAQLEFFEKAQIARRAEEQSR